MSAPSLPALRGRQLALIRPTAGPIPPRLGELWRYRELFFFLVQRDVKVRYAQTLLGGFWVVFQPVALMLVFSLAFRAVAEVETGDVPYPLFALAGLALWILVSRGVLQGASSLVSNIDLLTRTDCPRLLLPVATIVAVLLDFAVVFALLVAVAAGFGELPTWRLSLALPVVALGLAFTLGVSLLLSALNVRYRDVRQSLPFLVQLWLFVSPVAYPLDFGAPWSTIVALNPLVGTVEAFRWAVLAASPPSVEAIGIAVGVSLAAFALGMAYFSRVERTFADDV